MVNSRANKAIQRRFALQTLTRILSYHQYLDEALNEVPEEFRPWVHECTAGVLRWKGRLDWIIDQLTLKKKASGAIRKALLLAAYQLLEQPHVPQAWVVSETVDLVRTKEGELAAKFVNAILRRISDHVETWRFLSWPESTDPGALAKWASLPDWIWDRIVRDYGLSWAKDYAQACLNRPTYWVRSRKPMTNAEPGPLLESWHLDSWSPIQELQEYQEGRVFVQDISSQQLIQDFCEEAKKLIGTDSEKKILDLCAAPGGKSTGLSWNGWQVIATDREANTSSSQQRFKMLQETQSRINQGLGPDSWGQIQVISRSEVTQISNVDAVWVDAPCTGTGLLRRHPEVRWIKDEKTLKTLQEDQVRLIKEASGKVRSGGLLMYTVCSVLKSDELNQSIEQASLDQFRKVRDWHLFPQVSPHGDGFLGVLLQRT